MHAHCGAGARRYGCGLLAPSPVTIASVASWVSACSRRSQCLQSSQRRGRSRQQGRGGAGMDGQGRGGQ
eukprot:6381658-Pyramimonas_sp.AAC.1